MHHFAPGIAPESGIREIFSLGSRISSIGIRNPGLYWNPESVLQRKLESMHFSSHYEILCCINLEWSTFQLYAKHNARLSETPVPEIQKTPASCHTTFFVGTRTGNVPRFPRFHVSRKCCSLVMCLHCGLKNSNSVPSAAWGRSGGSNGFKVNFLLQFFFIECIRFVSC